MKSHSFPSKWTPSALRSAEMMDKNRYLNIHILMEGEDTAMKCERIAQDQEFDRESECSN